MVMRLHMVLQIRTNNKDVKAPGTGAAAAKTRSGVTQQRPVFALVGVNQALTSILDSTWKKEVILKIIAVNANLKMRWR